jgi:hypothetical protein
VGAGVPQLISADRDGGAKEAGVANSSNTQLTRQFKKHRAACRKGIVGVESASKRAFHVSCGSSLRCRGLIGSCYRTKRGIMLWRGRRKPFAAKPKLLGR